ncbi:uncharacterized protein [Branchiostoma lanceolatum]|uniref:uncharacterized protein n=1 Tax=Branchiostoma lanceolatum TaxID=7740 RepID=UPI003453253C
MQNVSAEGTSDFKLYIYELPAEFNRNIVSCVQKAESCFQLGSFGMGPEFARHGDTSYRRTHMFSLEVILHHKAMYSPARTLDPHAADAFYIPYYAGLACFCPGLDAAGLNRRMLSHLTARYPFYGRGRPHLMALGKIEREQWSTDCPLLRLPAARRIVFAGIEEEFTPALRAHFGRRGHPLIVAPYPAFGHFISSGSKNKEVNETLGNKNDVKPAMAGEPASGQRDVFVFLAASSRNAHRIRRALRPQFRATAQRYSRVAGRGDGAPVWLLTPECRGDWEGKVVEWMRHSVFCVQPPGDSPTRKSFYDAVSCGCVPVTFTLENPVRYPFDQVLNYSDFTVIIDVKDVTERNRTILHILRKIPEQKIKKMQDNLKKVAHLLQYSYPSTVPTEDAFSMILKEMARRADVTRRSRKFHLPFESRHRS